MIENQTEFANLSSLQGAPWKAQSGHGAPSDEEDTLDAELDAYLDRELLARPAPEVAPPAAAEKPEERLRGVLALAAEEEQWLRTLPPPELSAEQAEEPEDEECLIPEHLRSRPLPAVELALPVEPPATEAPWTPPSGPLPGLAVMPNLAPPGYSSVAPAPETSRRRLWILAGVLMSAASVFIAGMIWRVRARLPDRTQVMTAHVPAGTVTAMPTPPATLAPEPVPSVKDSPRSQQPEPLVAVKLEPQSEPIPKAVVQSVARRAEPATASVKPRETPQAKQAPAVQELQARRDVEDPSLEETEEETPFVPEPVAPPEPAPVAKAAPPPPEPPETHEYDEFDKDFARELGFTKDVVRKAPESTKVTSVWIPPAPGQAIPESLTPDDIQKVVVANQPAIASCIQRTKEALPSQDGGRFTMRWYVDPSGSTRGVSMETRALRGTALASCIEGLVKGWKFPRHRTPMAGPIHFPFIF